MGGPWQKGQDSREFHEGITAVLQVAGEKVLSPLQLSLAESSVREQWGNWILFSDKPCLHIVHDRENTRTPFQCHHNEGAMRW